MGVGAKVWNKGLCQLVEQGTQPKGDRDFRPAIGGRVGHPHLRHRQQEHDADGIAQEEGQQRVVGLADDLQKRRWRWRRRVSAAAVAEVLAPGCPRRTAAWPFARCVFPAPAPLTAKAAPTEVLSPAKVVSVSAHFSSSLSQGMAAS